MRKKSTRLTPENIFTKPKYKSILNLLIEYQDKEFSGKKGLRQLHFRYVLEKGYRNSNKYQVQSNARNLKKFFGPKLNALIKAKRIVPECISSRQMLSKMLNNLNRLPINAIEKSGSKPDVRYNIKQTFRDEGIRIQNIESINEFNNSQVRTFMTPGLSGISEITNVKHVFYGFSKSIFENLSDSEKKLFWSNVKKNALTHIEMEKLKSKKVEEIWNEKIDRFKRYTKNRNITRSLDYKPQGYGIKHLLFDELYRAVKISIEEKVSAEEVFLDSINDFFNNDDYEHFNLKQSDVKEIVDFGCKNVDFFLYDVYPLNVAISIFSNDEFLPFEKEWSSDTEKM